MVYLSNPAKIRKHIKKGKLLWCRKERSEQNFKEIENIKNVCLAGRGDTFFCIQVKNFYFIRKRIMPFDEETKRGIIDLSFNEHIAIRETAKITTAMIT
jgi:hypothetical protein